MPAPPLANTFESGLAHGTAITVANSDDGTAGNPFTGVDNAPLFDTSQAAHGSYSMLIPGSTPMVGHEVEFWGYGSLTTDVWLRIYARLPSQPSGNSLRLVRFFTGGGATSGYLYIEQGTGFVGLLNAAGGAGGTGAVEVAYNQWIRLEVRIRSATSNGQMEWRYYESADSMTITETEANTAMVLGADTNSAWIGNVAGSNGPSNYPYYIDDFAVSSTGWIGPSVAPAEKQSNYYSRRRIVRV